VVAAYPGLNRHWHHQRPDRGHQPDGSRTPRGSRSGSATSKTSAAEYGCTASGRSSVSRCEGDQPPQIRRAGFGGRFGAGLPRINDGSFLFLQNMISKMKGPEEGGTRLAIVFNGSPLFTGAAGLGESEIRAGSLGPASASLACCPGPGARRHREARPRKRDAGGQPRRHSNGYAWPSRPVRGAGQREAAPLVPARGHCD
jgi:hypothetical protein